MPNGENEVFGAEGQDERWIQEMLKPADESSVVENRTAALLDAGWNNYLELMGFHNGAQVEITPVGISSRWHRLTA